MFANRLLVCWYNVHTYCAEVVEHIMLYIKYMYTTFACEQDPLWQMWSYIQTYIKLQTAIKFSFWMLPRVTNASCIILLVHHYLGLLSFISWTLCALIYATTTQWSHNEHYCYTNLLNSFTAVSNLLSQSVPNEQLTHNHNEMYMLYGK